MLDINWIRENPQSFESAMKKRNIAPGLSQKILELDETHRRQITELQNLQQLKNESAKKISQIQDKKGDEFKSALLEANEIKAKISALETDTKAWLELDTILASLPNILDDIVPEGQTEDLNIEIRKYGTPKTFSYAPKQHFEIGENLGLIDFEQTAKMSGSRFVTLKNQIARMERALANFMLDHNTLEYGHEEICPPYLVLDQAMYGVGLLPKFADESFQTTNGYRLIPTSEVSLTNLVADKILTKEELPLRYTAYSACFRSEAGSAGKDTRGMIRLHQFSKVELVTITTEEDSNNELERMVNCAEMLLQKLEIPYRVILKCAGDTGFQAQKGYDIEVWLPGQNCYREISSISNCGAFQARRMKTRYREKDSKNTKPVHTLNGSSLAIGRTIVAILENYQNEDGSINVPEKLVPYMGGINKIG